MQVIAGIDIGGTKCAVSFARVAEDAIEVLRKTVFPTPALPGETLEKLMDLMERQLEEKPLWRLAAIGISCGGPLDGQRGMILSPPNLPHWDKVDCFSPLKARFHVPVALQNDADACALAEWRWGAGRGCRNMVFLTFGTGMGAGLILDGKLYVGSSNLAGEIGHIRLSGDGPMGYGKNGSFEGYCSGGGIADLGRRMAREAIAAGTPPAFCPTEAALGTVTAKSIGLAAERGDPLALRLYGIVGTYLGKGLSVLIDVLNPEVIVIGSIFARQKELMEKNMYEELSRESLAPSRRVCRIVPAELGESVGDFASLSVAMGTLCSGREARDFAAG